MSRLIALAKCCLARVCGCTRLTILEDTSVKAEFADAVPGVCGDCGVRAPPHMYADSRFATSSSHLIFLLSFHLIQYISYAPKSF